MEERLKYLKKEVESGNSNIIVDKEIIDYMLFNIGNLNFEIRDNLIYELFFLLLSNDLLTFDDFDYIVNYILENKLLIFNNFSKDVDSVVLRSFTSLILALFLLFDGYEDSIYYNKIPIEKRRCIFDLAIDCVKLEKSNLGYHKSYGWIHSIAHLSELLLSIVKHFDCNNFYFERVLDSIYQCLINQKEIFSDGDEKRLGLVIIFMLRESKICFETFLTFVRKINSFYNEDFDDISKTRSKENVKNMINYIFMFFRNEDMFKIVLNEIDILNDIK